MFSGFRSGICSHAANHVSMRDKFVQTLITVYKRVYATACENGCSKSIHTSAYSLNKVPGEKINNVTNRAVESILVKSSETISDDSLVADDDDKHIMPALEAHTPNKPEPTFVNIVPGKGPPPEPPIDCCMSGCANCVWIQYAEELKNYYTAEQGNQTAREAIELIENPGLKMFLKCELGFL